jgi:hypothetical protein
VETNSGQLTRQNRLFGRLTSSALSALSALSAFGQARDAIKKIDPATLYRFERPCEPMLACSIAGFQVAGSREWALAIQQRSALHTERAAQREHRAAQRGAMQTCERPLSIPGGAVDGFDSCDVLPGSILSAVQQPSEPPGDRQRAKCADWACAICARRRAASYSFRVFGD